MEKSFSASYAAAGVDVTAGYESVERIKAHVKRTTVPGVLGGIGGFGGMFQLPVNDYKEPVLVSGTDGVGTKLKIAFLMDKHDTVGIDCVAMCVNDVACSGAKPLFFLDYIACGKNFPEKIEQIVAGVAEGCVQAGCALVGGETAEMPGFYPEDEYDLAGFSVGVGEKSKLVSGAELQAGLCTIALCSRQQAPQTMRALAALCRRAAQSQYAAAQRAAVLAPKLGICGGLLAAILLWPAG